MPGNALIQSLERGLDVLRLLGESPGGLSPGDILAATGLKRPTVHNLLRTLASRGFVVRVGPAYRLGPAVHRLVGQDGARLLLARAEEAVRVLAERLPAAIVSFCEPLGGDMLVRLRRFPDRLLPERNSGAVMEPYRTASGLAFLAFADAETRQLIQMRHPFPLEGSGVWQTEERLDAFLHEAQASGVVLPPFCVNSRFRLAALPVLAASGRLEGVLGAAWHVVPGAPEDGTEAVVMALREAAAVCAGRQDSSEGEPIHDAL